MLAGGQQTAHNIALHLGVTDRVKGRYVFNEKLTVAAPGHDVWTWPLRWKGAQHRPGKPSLIFVGDMADLFHEGRPTSVIDRACATIAASDHIGQLLTKRAQRMTEYFTALPERTRRRWQAKLWLGFCAERQKEFDERWPHVRELARGGWVVFVSIAPMIGPVTLPPDFLALKERAWVICSGEQGKHEDCRDMDPAWARALRDQCTAAGVPFFMKQMARKAPIPPDLLIRTFPVCAGTVRWKFTFREERT